ncbi:MAG: M10 family metallopeptidase, partial [Rhodobacteraceae bacterium]|nr:M10 family metallopeptidase [Paracoccaceae bacterium]
MPVLNETTDAAASTGTTYTMGVGDYFFGNLGFAGDSDWIAVDLVAGQTYTFAMTGVGGNVASLNDSYLRLHNSAGTEITFDDDGGPGLFSDIQYTATTTGRYYINAGSYGNSLSGTYGVTVTHGSVASLDVIMGAGVLTRPDLSWSAADGTPVNVTWAARASGPATDAGGNPVAFEFLTAAQINAISQALAMFEGVSGLSFTQVNPGGYSDSATMLFGGYTSFTDGAGAYANYPGSTLSSSAAGDVWINNSSVSQTSLPTGSYDFFAILHEIGHAVGLAHPGDYNAAPGVNITYAGYAQFIEDSHQYTVMSYFDESNTTTSVPGYSDTLMMYDIYALHQLYGADMTFHAGNSVYGFNSNLGGVYDFTSNTDPLLCIWDGAGIDTIDLSGYGMNQYLNLGAGTFSNVGGYVGNVSIAVGATIENGTTGSGHDRIIGNNANNILIGNSGNDTLIGGGGHDRIYGGVGFDRL